MGNSHCWCMLGMSNVEMKHPGAMVLDDNAGERMVPEVSGGMTFWEHVHRYAFACRFVAGKRVLDVASAEGYGAAALQKGRSRACDRSRRLRICLLSRSDKVWY